MSHLHCCPWMVLDIDARSVVSESVIFPDIDQVVQVYAMRIENISCHLHDVFMDVCRRIQLFVSPEN